MARPQQTPHDARYLPHPDPNHNWSVEAENDYEIEAKRQLNAEGWMTKEEAQHMADKVTARGQELKRVNGGNHA